MCILVLILCKDRSKYVFWDEYYFIDKVNEFVVNIFIKRFDFMCVDDGFFDFFFFVLDFVFFFDDN